MKMKTSLPYFLKFPDNFYNDVVSKIINASSDGRNVQLVGLKGSGKSLLFRYILTSEKFKSQFNIFKIDLNLIPERTAKACSELLLSELSRWTNNQNNLGKKTIILVDSFENMYDLSNSLKSIFSGITDTYRDYISFVFSIERPIESNDIYWGKVIFNTSLIKSDFDWFWKGIGGVEKYKNKIYKATGGFMALIKRLNEIAKEGGDLDEAINNPRLNAHLNYQLELMKEGLKGNKSYFDVPIYNTFIDGGDFRSEFTKLENNALKYLNKNLNVIVDREDLIQAIWGEHASQNVADHALDQLMHRLKLKLKNSNMKLETIRGRGHRLQDVVWV